jgi:hypothetical protein
VLTKINSDIECALAGFLKNRVKMHGDDNKNFIKKIYKCPTGKIRLQIPKHQGEATKDKCIHMV